LSEKSLQELIEIAKQARLHSLHPFKLPGGAAARTADGKVYTGCNVESASYGLTVAVNACHLEGVCQSET